MIYPRQDLLRRGGWSGTEDVVVGVWNDFEFAQGRAIFSEPPPRERPRHDGIEILERLRESPLAHIPVVVLTSSDSPRDRQMADRLGAARYLRKPSSLEQFLGLGAVFKDLLGPTETQSKR